MFTQKKKIAAAILAAAVATAVIAHAPPPLFADDDRHGRERHDHHDDHDHDRALGAVQRGEVLPLEKVLATIRANNSGTVVGVKLVQDDGKWLYKMKIVGSDGRLRKIAIDAKTGTQLSAKED